jgi:hypothetical protein
VHISFSWRISPEEYLALREDKPQREMLRERPL